MNDSYSEHRSEHNNETVLLLFSGGVDSSYLLHYYLLQTNLAVHAHYISMRYPHIRRWEKEDAAVAAIIDYCRARYRAFDVSYSTSEMAAWPLVGWDSNIQLTTAARIAPNLPGNIVSVVRGRCADDMLQDPSLEAAKVKQRHDLWRALHASIHPEHRHRVNPEHYSPLVRSGVGKAEIVDDIPQDLLRLCWSCRVPVVREGELYCCGTCTPCQRFNVLLKQRSLNTQFPNLCTDLS